MYNNLVPRFIKYVKKDTRSNPDSNTVPSTKSQIDFAKYLVEELNDIGMSDVHYNEKNGYVIATLPSNSDKKVRSIGLISHMDTAEFNSENIEPKFVENYDGESDIKLDEAGQLILTVKEFPNLKKYKGQTLITTNGKTLLGADDKAGIAEIMTTMEVFINNPSLKHGEIKVAFSPDEEIGTGVDNFDIKEFNVDYAYTVDGGCVGELKYETFNAAKAKVTIIGKIIHPGVAKNKMINALKLAALFDNSLPQDMVPEKTEGYEGFFFLMKITGDMSKAEMTYIIRDHDSKKLEEYKQLMISIKDEINSTLDQDRVSIEIQDQYRNMKEVIQNDMSVVEIAKRAMYNLGIEPIIEPIRGGTDGAKISFLGIPTPNLFAGSENYHGPFEFVAVESMIKACDVIKEIIILNEKEG